MHLAALWRYPVKSMAGEPLDETQLDALGVLGDRDIYVLDQRGRLVTARSRPQLLAHRATRNNDGNILVDGLPWTDLEVARRVEVAAGAGARLVRAQGAERFDILPLLVVSDGALAALGADVRRLRPNLVIGGVAGLAEREWEGRFLRIGEAVIGFADLRGRCIMTTWNPDTREQNLEVLLDIRHRFGGKFGLNAWVERPGRVAVGDGAELLDEAALL
ncbi:MAG: MOSC N-terminal beta barrel domain-containing protein [Anaerolineae bacterium]|nr:MOSC N-terminal beta barrel domain-containing protein [Gemmatimonadaceae bacterium]